MMIKHFLTVLILIGSISVANAQKDPQVQQVSFRVPENVKIDGRLDEWKGIPMKASNSTNRIYYTVSNDDENLYLSVCGYGQGVSVKSLNGGMIFTISHSVEKKVREKAIDNVSITFPIQQDIKTTANIMQAERMYAQLPKGKEANHKQMDSVEDIANKRLADVLTEIKVIGVKEIPDTIISIYNTERVKAMARFWELSPIIELAIPLKYLKLDINNPIKFSYNIKLPGPPPTPGINDDILTPNDLYAIASTDFWGEYMLAKKPY